MTAFVPPTRPTYANLLDHQLLPPYHPLPQQLTHLSDGDRRALLDDPLKVRHSTSGLIYRVQRELFRSFAHKASGDVQRFAKGIERQPIRVLDFVADCDKVTQSALSAAVVARTITSVEAKDLYDTFEHLQVIMIKVRPFVPSAS